MSKRRIRAVAGNSSLVIDLIAGHFTDWADLIAGHFTDWAVPAEI
jgi:hypothetical protein